jgi:hypothetical protein
MRVIQAGVLVVALGLSCSESTQRIADGATDRPGLLPDGTSGERSLFDGARTEKGSQTDGGGKPGAQGLPADRIIDWSTAGVVQPGGAQGIPARTSVCATIDAATYGGGTKDVSAALQAAVDGCAANGVVALPAGTYLLSKPVKVNRPVVIRGAGPGTKIVESGANLQFGTAPGSALLYQTDWTAGYTKGTTTITLADTSHLTVGQTIVLDQLNDTGVTTAGYVPVVNPVGNEGTVGVGVNTCASRSGLSFCTDGKTPVPRALMQLAEVTAIAGNQVTLDRPIYITHLASLAPQAFFWAGGNLKYAGIESLRIDAQYTDQAVAFQFCSHCWAKAIEVAHIARGGVSLWYADHFELRDSYFLMNQASAPTNYGVEVDDTGASRFENNLFDSITIGLIVSWSSSGNVVGYNFSANEDPGSLVLGAAHGTHSVHAFMNLFEGNVAGKLGFDHIWGSASHQTLFRNRLSGYMKPRSSGSGTWSNGNWPLVLEAWNRDFNIVGNVLGEPEVQNGYQAADVASGKLVGATGYSSSCQCCSCGMGVAPIYVLGYWSSWDATGHTTDFDPQVAATLWRWGNYDYFTKQAHWDAAELPAGYQAPADHTLPPSLYLPAKPAWFGNLPFPAIGPDVSGYASKIPAQVCYESMTMGGQGYDPKKCY